MKYSIWIIPPKPIFGELEKIINELSSRHKSPVFKPHMTVLGSIDKDLNEIQEAVRKVVVHADILELSLGPISFSTTYFQSVFVRVNSTAKLMQFNLDIKELLNAENSVFMPHISLMYGNHSMETREKVAQEIQLTKSKFTVNELVIVSEQPGKWKPITTISFWTNK